VGKPTDPPNRPGRDAPVTIPQRAADIAWDYAPAILAAICCAAAGLYLYTQHRPPLVIGAALLAIYFAVAYSVTLTTELIRDRWWTR